MNTTAVITFVIEDTDSNTLRNILRTIRNEPTFEALAMAIRSELAFRRAFVDTCDKLEDAANIPS